MYKNILVPIAFDDDDRAAQAIEVAQALSESGAKITLLHVIEQVPSYVVSYLPQEYMAESRKAIQAEISDLAAPIENGSGVVVDGHSGRTILDYAKEAEIDCIVIASHRPGMQDLLIGSTAAYVVRHAACAVHVMR